MSAIEHASRATSQATAMEYALARDDIESAMQHLRRCNDALAETAMELVAAGVRRGMTQREMAEALGVPASALRGARREFAS